MLPGQTIHVTTRGIRNLLGKSSELTRSRDCSAACATRFDAARPTRHRASTAPPAAPRRCHERETERRTPATAKRDLAARERRRAGVARADAARGGRRRHSSNDRCRASRPVGGPHDRTSLDARRVGRRRPVDTPVVATRHQRAPALSCTRISAGHRSRRPRSTPSFASHQDFPISNSTSSTERADRAMCIAPRYCGS